MKVESLVSASVSGSPLDSETSRWLGTIGQDLTDKLSRAKLIAPRESATLGQFVDAYIASRADAKPNTIRNFRNSRDKLVAHFGSDRDWRTIKPGDADDWRQSLVNQGLSEATVSKAVKHAKQYGRLAYRKGLVAENPFQDLVAGSERNDSRPQFIEQSTVRTVLDACPDAPWRLIVTLARYGGLRTPSETLALKWSHVDWAGERFTAPAPKNGGAREAVPDRADLPRIATLLGGGLRSG